MVSRLGPIAIVAVVFASISQVEAMSVVDPPVPTITIVEGDQLPLPSVTTFGLAGVSISPEPESVTVGFRIRGLADFGPAGLILTKGPGGPISDILTVGAHGLVISDVSVTFTSDSETGPALTAPTGEDFRTVDESTCPCIFPVSLFFTNSALIFKFDVSVLSDSDAATVPEPASLLLLGSALAVLAGAAWKRHRK